MPDLAKAAQHYQRFMEALGLPLDVHSRNTPKRAAAALAEMTQGLRKTLRFTVFPSHGTDELIVVKDISFTSLCAHHHLPFFGKAAVGYLPNSKIVGLSKIARLVDHLAHRPQVQERLTEEIADTMMLKLKPRAVLVLLEATHGCMAFRGVGKAEHKTLTSALRGEASLVISLRSEFLALVR